MYKDSIVDPRHSPENFEYSRSPFNLVDFGFANFKAMNTYSIQLQNCPVSLMDCDRLAFCHFPRPSFAAVSDTSGLRPTLPFIRAVPSYFRPRFRAIPLPIVPRREIIFKISLCTSGLFLAGVVQFVLGFNPPCSLSVLIVAFGPFTFNISICRAVPALPGSYSFFPTDYIFPLPAFLGILNTDCFLVFSFSPISLLVTHYFTISFEWLP